MTWNTDNIPDLSGRVALVTGGNTGLGYRTSLELARKGALVFVAARRDEDGQAACDAIQQAHPGALVKPVQLDLLRAESIKACAEDVMQRTDRLDILVNNAGVVNLPELRRSPEGHEMHMATNHYGHFALTGHLFDLIARTPGARVVTLSSGAYRSGTIDFDDLDWRKRAYTRMGSYGDSKLANLHFMQALQQRFEEAGSDAISVAAHPGLTGTQRQQTIGIGGAFSRWLAAPVSQGVLHQLHAATASGVRGGDFFGPRWGLRGRPHRIKLDLDANIGARLWSVTEDITGITY